MQKTRFQKVKLNMLTTLAYQLVTVLCGVVIPKFMINAYGSETYGVITSITQFLSYVALLEGGISGVARAELYRPLAEQDIRQTSRIYCAIIRFFRIIGCIFLGYTVLLACFYHKMADVSFLSRRYTFCLVVVISISTIAQYFFGIANLTLLNADQKRYVSNVVMIVTTALNAILVVILIKLNCDVLIVKLASSSIFVIRPLLFSAYVKKHYRFDPRTEHDITVLKQRWTGMGHHLAYYLHSNTDIVLLTLFANMKYVAVYAVYNFVISSIRNIITALTGGMEPVFGEIIAQNDEESLRITYQYYELVISFTTLVLFATTGILIVPFIELYTEGVADADYIQPVFALIMILAEAIYCIFLPVSTIPDAANRFRETKWGAYGEAIINIGISYVLISWNPLIGVAIGTAISVIYKNIYFFIYAVRNILKISPKSILRLFAYVAALFFVILLGKHAIKFVLIDTFLKWTICGAAVFLWVGSVVFAVYAVAFGEPFLNSVRKICEKMFQKTKVSIQNAK